MVASRVARRYLTVEAQQGPDHLLTLGRRLRALREQAGMKGGDLAHALGWAQSKVSRIELARQNASPADVSAWVEVTGGPDHERVFLLGLLDQAREDQHAWRQRMRGGQAPVQAGYFALVQRATLLRGFHTAVVPGLLQTPDYARCILTIAARQAGAPTDDVDAAVANRMKRQAFLDTPRRFEYLLSESVLRLGLVPADVMRTQLERLVAASELANVRIAVLPLGVPLTVTPLHEFEIFDDLAIIETISREHRHTGPEADTYKRAFAELWTAALTGDEARAIFRQVARNLV